MSASQDTSFTRLVSLACHDLRTPLATVHGFASTLAAREIPPDAARRYLTIMAEATDQLAELLDELALAARIEGGRWEPALQDVDALELARGAADRAGEERAAASGEGEIVRVDPEAIERALAALAIAAQRHGGVDRVELQAAGREVLIRPVVADAAPVVVAEDLRDLGAAVARKVVEAHGGSVALEGETLRVRLG